MTWMDWVLIAVAVLVAGYAAWCANEDRKARKRMERAERRINAKMEIVGFCDECLLFEGSDGWPKAQCNQEPCKYRRHTVRNGEIDTGHVIVRLPE